MSRASQLHDRNFGLEAEAVRSMKCLVHRAFIHSGMTEAQAAGLGWRGCSGGRVRACHIGEPRKMGAHGGGRFDLGPLCDGHHAAAGEPKTFGVLYGLDLRFEADRVALEHAAPLGIRGLAARVTTRSDGNLANVGQAGNPFALPGFTAYECHALLGWVARRMERLSVGLDHVDPKQYLAERIGDELEIDTGQLHAEYLDLAWALCGLAGWPS